MIVVGYSGIGKSTLGGKQDCIDLESSNLRVKDQVVHGWARVYCNIAEHLSSQGYTVLVSSHYEVREIFTNDIISGATHEKFYCVFPSPELKSHWITKLKRRYDKSKLEKDWRAYHNVMMFYDENIKELSTWTYAEPVMLTDMTYSLSTIVDKLQIANHDDVCLPTLAGEEWKQLEGRYASYEVSNLGRVRSVPREREITRKGKKELWVMRGKILKPIITGMLGPLYVHLYDDNKVRDAVAVKYLVAHAFLGYNGRTKKIFHKDGDKFNCRADNLYIKE